jgi:hypothetical protein
MKRRIAGVVAFAGVLLLGPGAAAASAAPPTQRPVEWRLTADQCPNLPAGTTVNGIGTLTEVQGGRVSIERATGTATDQAGNVYRWSYSFRAVSRPGKSQLWVDHFVLAGAGPARLNNGFVAEASPDGEDIIRVIHEFGNPIDFETITAICDPL